MRTFGLICAIGVIVALLFARPATAAAAVTESRASGQSISSADAGIVELKKDDGDQNKPKDKPKKSKKNDDKDDDSDDGDAGQGNDDKTKNNDGTAND